MRKLLAGAFLIALAFALPAQARPFPKPFTYTVSGGNITGTLGSNFFSNATWSITTTADASLVTSPTTSWSPLNMVEATPILSITSGLQTYTATLLNTESYYWVLVSRDYSAGGEPFGMVGFEGFGVGHVGFEGIFAFYLNGASNFNSLTEPLAFSGQSGANPDLTLATDMGGLTLTGDTGENGSFSSAAVAAVPEPSTYAALMGVAALGFVSWRRRQLRLMN